MSGRRKKKSFQNGSSDGGRKDSEWSRSSKLIGGRRSQLPKALTILDNTTVYEACQRMTRYGVDAVLLTGTDDLLSGIFTVMDIAMRVVACDLNVKDTPISKVMTRNPHFILSDELAVEALQRMVQGNFMHFPVVENGEVVGFLHTAKCLYDAIAHMERAVGRSKAFTGAVKGPTTFLLHSRSSLSTIITENSKIVEVSSTDSVLTASKKMLDLRQSSAVVTVGSKPQGILTSKDILLRVIANNLSPDSTPVGKVMTLNPKCATVDTSIVDALKMLQHGEFSHLPIVDKAEGSILGVVDLMNISRAVVAAVGNTDGDGNDAASAPREKFWDFAPAWGYLIDDDAAQSEGSMKLVSEGADTGRYAAFPSSCLGTSFVFMLEDRKGQSHIFNCEPRSMKDLIMIILQKVGNDINPNHLPRILYEDEEHDKVMLVSDSDLAAALDYARLSGWKGIRLHLDFLGSDGGRKSGGGSGSMEYEHKDARAAARFAVATGAILVVGLGVMAYLKRASS